MKVIIAGSRNVTNYQFVRVGIRKSGFDITEVVSGTARGVDQMGENWAEVVGVPCKKFPADWDKHGKSAGYQRNMQMGLYADALIAVWDGKSRGTLHMINIMQGLSKPVFVVRTDGQETKA